MLVLSRNKNESITLRIDGKVVATFTMIEVRGSGRVRVGIEAADFVTINRDEIDAKAFDGREQYVPNVNGKAET